MEPVSYVWTEQYQAAVLELNSEKLLDQVVKAEALIHQLQAELHNESSTDGDELEAIARALQVLGQLREISQKSTKCTTRAEERHARLLHAHGVGISLLNIA